MEIKIVKHLLDESGKKAEEIRKILNEHKILMINIIGSPGCGKTTLLEKTLSALTGKLRCAVIEGDVATDRDAVRLQKYNIPICLINTGGACHLEPMSIRKSLDEIDLSSIDVIFVENIGNLLCPAEFDIGENAKVAVISVTEGHDKPEKYPLLFNECKAVILNKIDLLPYTDFDKGYFYKSVTSLNGKVPIIEISGRSGEGIEKWLEWVSGEVKKIRER
ncbi:MAG: hydrogenase nickel incorporation protein HypB [Chitinispirillaceae bacterium]|nr:hydrogenase nickel incorporation protein HypB [Chitinispirillaceae bacterium]